MEFILFLSCLHWLAVSTSSFLRVSFPKGRLFSEGLRKQCMAADLSWMEFALGSRKWRRLHSVRHCETISHRSLSQNKCIWRNELVGSSFMFNETVLQRLFDGRPCFFWSFKPLRCATDAASIFPPMHFTWRLRQARSLCAKLQGLSRHLAHPGPVFRWHSEKRVSPGFTIGRIDLSSGLN